MEVAAPFMGVFHKISNIENIRDKNFGKDVF